MPSQRHNLDIISMPATREPVSLLSVERGISELRRGRAIAIQGGDGKALLVRAAEGVTDQGLRELETLSANAAFLSLTARRAAVLGLSEPEGKFVTITSGERLTAESINEICDPLIETDIAGLDIVIRETSAYDSARAAVMLAKLARLLPATVGAVIKGEDANDLAGWCARRDLLMVDAGDIFQYEITAARTLRAVSEANVPLADAENCRIIAFRPSDGGLEHLAIVIGDPKPGDPLLVRLHSECFTGDLLGSLRCDCGDQLRGAISEISTAGSGILIYMAQEGRGIGLVNKLRAYALQDKGFDTLDANEQLGFDADERVYLPAARILNLLGFRQIRLMTNNPLKVDALQQFGLDVLERVPHSFPSNKHNEHYLRTKKQKSGHLL